MPHIKSWLEQIDDLESGKSPDTQKVVASLLREMVFRVHALQQEIDDLNRHHNNKQ